MAFRHDRVASGAATAVSGKFLSEMRSAHQLLMLAKILALLGWMQQTAAAVDTVWVGDQHC
jgi:hypothetical protein